MSHAPAAWAPEYAPPHAPRPARQPPAAPRPAPRRTAPRHPVRRGAAKRRLAALLLAAGSSTAVVTVAALMPAHSRAPHSGPHSGLRSRSSAAAPFGGPSTPAMMAAAGNVGWRMGLPAKSAPSAGLSAYALTARDYRLCPRPATACVDLARHLTWLQAGGVVTFGPVQMEPGPPGSAHATPLGTFHVSWKAGPTYISTIYHDPMPWAVFFAAGGVAFHAGSLTTPSHGCVHLTLANAYYYHQNLPIGAEVVVF